MWRIPLSEPSPIVVLGASGTIGSHLCTNLIARGLPVRAVWRSRPVQIPGVQSAKVDVASGEGVNEALPCDEDRINFIDARDIATVAAANLAKPAQSEAYALSGPQALTFGEAVAVLAQATGKQLRYECVSEADFHTDMERFGLPSSYIHEVIELCASYRRGESEPVTSIVSDITGHPAIPFSGFARDHAAILR